MNKLSKRGIMGISLAAGWFVWFMAIVIYNIANDGDWECWGGITYTAIALGVSELYLLVFRKNPGRSGTETGAIGVILTICFLLIDVLFNTVCILLEAGSFENWFPMIMNMVFVIGYVVLIMWVGQGTNRVATLQEKTEKKTAPTMDLSRKLGELLGLADDDEIRGKLYRLKEMVDYGTNISTNATLKKEVLVNEKLDEIAQLMISRADRRIILKKIDDAQKLWSMRSSTSATVR